MVDAALPPVDVVVPSFRRPAQLERCLEGIGRQILTPQRVVVVLRAEDSESRSVVAGAAVPGLVTVTVEHPGVLAAMATGMARTKAPLVALTDDDAVPRADWLRRLAALMADEGVGAAGGRDVIAGCTEPPTDDVGRIRWWGGHVGNHHRGRGEVREVSILKGVNVMFRADALALPAPGVLRGFGAQAHWEILVCAHLRRCRLRLLYDPHAVVDHRRGDRFDDDDRAAPSRAAVADRAHNVLMGTAGLAPARRPIHYLGGVVRGDRSMPGIGRASVAVLRREPGVAERLLPALRGRSDAYRRLGLRGTAAMVNVRSTTPSAAAPPARAGGRGVPA